MEVRIDKFGGLYVNTPGHNVNPEFFRVFSGTFNGDYLEAKEFTPEDVTFPTDNLVYIDHIYLDNDKDSYILQSGTRKSNYIYSREEYDIYIYQIEDTVSIKLLGSNKQYNFEANGKFQYLSNDNNICHLLISNEYYQIRKIDSRGIKEIKDIKLTKYYNPGITLSEISAISKVFQQKGEESSSGEFILYQGNPNDLISYFQQHEHVKVTYVKDDKYFVFYWNIEEFIEVDEISGISISRYELRSAVNSVYKNLTEVRINNFLAYASYGPTIGFFDSEEEIFQYISELIKTIVTIRYTYKLDPQKPIEKIDYIKIFLTAKYFDGTEIKLGESFIIPNNKANIMVDYTLKGFLDKNTAVNLSSIRIYTKLLEDVDYELIKEYKYEDILNENFILQFTINKNDLKGIYLGQTYGKYDLTPMTRFDYFHYMGEVMFVISGNNIYYPIIGNGVYTKLFVKENVIPSISGSVMSSFVDNLVISDNNKTDLVLVKPTEGILLFYHSNTLPFRIKDKNDIIYLKDGLIIHTSLGIFVYGQGKLELISEAINNIVIRNYDSGNIKFSVYYNCLLYTHNSNDMYIYDISRKMWKLLKFNSVIDDVITTSDGRIYVKFNNSDLKELKLNNKDIVLETHDLLYGYTTFYKRPYSISLHLEGTAIIELLNWRKEISGNGLVTVYLPLWMNFNNEKVIIKITLKAGSKLKFIVVNINLERKINELIIYESTGNKEG